MRRIPVPQLVLPAPPSNTAEGYIGDSPSKSFRSYEYINPVNPDSKNSAIKVIKPAETEA